MDTTSTSTSNENHACTSTRTGAGREGGSPEKGERAEEGREGVQASITVRPFIAVPA